MPRQRKRALDAYIGARLRLRRLMLGMSQEILATKLGLTFQQVQKYENGTNSISAGRLFDLAHALDVPVQYFSTAWTAPKIKVTGAACKKTAIKWTLISISSAARRAMN